AQVLIPVQHDGAGQVADGDYRALEVPVAPRLGRAVLRFHGVGVDVGTSEALDGGDQVGADALRDETRGVGGLRVHGDRATVGTHRHPGHRLDAAGQDQVLPAGADLHRAEVDRLQARRAEPVDLQPGDGVGQASGQCRGTWQVPALVADRGHHAEHDVVDPLGVEVRVAVAQLVDQPGDQGDRLDAVQRAGRLALTPGGAQGFVEECFSHDGLPVLELAVLGRADSRIARLTASWKLVTTPSTVVGLSRSSSAISAVRSSGGRPRSRYTRSTVSWNRATNSVASALVCRSMICLAASWTSKSIPVSSRLSP